MNLDDYLKKKFRKKYRFGALDHFKINENFMLLQEDFPALCDDCTGGKRCPYRKGGRTIVLVCPHYAKRQYHQQGFKPYHR